jgi:uncharacterized protein
MGAARRRLREETVHAGCGVGGLLCLVLVPSARAASFDCAKASTFVEKAICSDKQLSGLDDQLAGLYKAARATAANSATLEAEQQAWLSARDQCTNAACLKKAYADRIAALKGSSAVPASGNLTGDVQNAGSARR